MGHGKSDFLSGQKAVALNIQTRLLSFLGNCPWDMKAGIDWITLLGKSNTATQIQLNVRTRILQSYGVLRINSLSASFKNRVLSLSFNINTKFTSNFSQKLENIINPTGA
jgi:hypothetical protein